MLREFFCWLLFVVFFEKSYYNFIYIKLLKYYGNVCFCYVYLKKMFLVIVFNIYCLEVVILNCMEVVVVV